VVRPVHGAHPALAQRRHDFVGSNARPRLERHWRDILLADPRAAREAARGARQACTPACDQCDSCRRMTGRSSSGATGFDRMAAARAVAPATSEAVTTMTGIARVD